MLYRTLAVFIVCFWLTMIGLLVRKEAGPAGFALREVPVGHVVKLILLHGQKSEMLISSEKQRIGFLSILPQMPEAGRSRAIEFNGNMQLTIPGADRQRVQWDGKWELEKTLSTRRFIISITFRESRARPEFASRVQLTVEPAENRLTYKFYSGDLPLNQPRTYTLDDAGLKKALADMEVTDPTILKMIEGRTRSIAPPVVKAFQASILIHGQPTDTYHVSVQQSGQTLLEFDVSQLGDILCAKTLLGYTLAQEDVVP